MQGTEKEGSESGAVIRALVVTKKKQKNKKQQPLRKLLQISGEISKQTFSGVLGTESVVLNNTHGLGLLEEMIFSKYALFCLFDSFLVAMSAVFENLK